MSREYDRQGFFFFYTFGYCITDFAQFRPERSSSGWTLDLKGVISTSTHHNKSLYYVSLYGPDAKRYASLLAISAHGDDVGFLYFHGTYIGLNIGVR